MADIVGTEDNDRLRGTTASETIDGLGGNDWIYGGDDGAIDEIGDDPITEPDVINGGDGNDVLIGGRLSDTIYGGDGDDIIRDSWFVDDPSQGGYDNDLIDGGAGNDTILYTSRDSWPVYNISGGDGYDTFRLIGPSWVSLDMGAASIEAFMADDTNPLDGQIDIYAGSQTQGVLIRGGFGLNVLIGSDFNDRIFGGAGQ